MLCFESFMKAIYSSHAFRSVFSRAAARTPHLALTQVRKPLKSVLLDRNYLVKAGSGRERHR